MRLAVGTSLAIIAASSLLGLATHLATGRSLDAPVTAAMTVACVAGALAGVAVADRIPHRRLGHGFACLVAAIATFMLISAAFLGEPPGS